MKWNELSMRDKSQIMKVAVSHGVYKLDDIKNIFDNGGNLKDREINTNVFNKSENAISNELYNRAISNSGLSRDEYEKREIKNTLLNQRMRRDATSKITAITSYIPGPVGAISAGMNAFVDLTDALEEPSVFNTVNSITSGSQAAGISNLTKLIPRYGKAIDFVLDRIGNVDTVMDLLPYQAPPPKYNKIFTK